jgi:hypothetical protein
MLGIREGIEFVETDGFYYDYICTSVVLMPLVGIDSDMMPFSIPYLYAEKERSDLWRSRLNAGGFRIGIAWQTETDRTRNVPLASFAPIARLQGVELISLQINFGLDQLENLPTGMSVTTLGPDFNAGEDRVVDDLAVMEHLDLIITCDTSIGHIAGASGNRVWVILSSTPDWRWIQDWKSTEERQDSPWYPNMRMFRQKNAGDWGEVFGRVVAELTNLMADGGRR